MRQRREGIERSVTFGGFKAPARLAIVVLVLAGAALAAARSGLDAEHLQVLLQHHRLAPLLFLGLHVAFSLLFLPRAAMAIVAGLIFGFWTGLFWATAGCTLGGLVGFLLTRYLRYGTPSSAERSRFRGLLSRVERGGWRAVMMLRLVPVIPHSLTNYLLGLTALPLDSFVLGSLVGQLPMTVAFVQFGAAGTQLMAGRPDWVRPTLIGLGILAASAMLPKLLGKPKIDGHSVS